MYFLDTSGDEDLLCIPEIDTVVEALHRCFDYSFLSRNNSISLPCMENWIVQMFILSSPSALLISDPYALRDLDSFNNFSCTTPNSLPDLIPIHSDQECSQNFGPYEPEFLIFP
jgi:hypothetical protein